ncbi:hypothetical protein R80B4_00194 [Fibrobacteres bacterium R8-0-B4]
MPPNTVTVTANFIPNDTGGGDTVVTPPGGGDSYESVTIGGKKWMKKNLNIETADSWCYDNNPANCDKYGRLYTWAAAKTACPSGWHLPTRAEWDNLVTAAGGSSTAGKKLKAASGWNSNGNGTDDHGFSALPGGYRLTDGSFSTAGSSGFWWTATEYGGDYAYYRYMNYYDDYVLEYNDYKGYGFSVRCVEGDGGTPTPVYTVTVSSAGSGATGGGSYAAGTTVNISAGTAPSGQTFKNWTATGVTLPNANSAATSFIMPSNAVTVTAVFEAAMYTVTVSSAGSGATGSGSYAAGATVNIFAGTPPAYRQFKNWTATGNGVTFANANSAATTFTMPPNAVTVTAVFDTLSITQSGGGGGSGDFVTIGGKKWMKKNLDIVTANSWCYGNNDTLCNMYGRLYTWDAARTVCPNGWRLPTRADWDSLARAVGGSKAYNNESDNHHWDYAGKYLKSTSGWRAQSGNGTDDYGFAALPGGHRYTDGRFYNAGYLGYWWTATEIRSGYAYSRYMSYEHDHVVEDDLGKDLGYSVRCVAD